MQSHILIYKKIECKSILILICIRLTIEYSNSNRMTETDQTRRNKRPNLTISIVGISRMDDDCEYEREHGEEKQEDQCEPESPTTAMRKAAHKKFQLDAAASARCNRRRAKTNTIYLPGTHPKFPAHVKQLMANIKNPACGDVHNWQAAILVSALQTLRIRLVVDPAINLAQLRMLCVQTSVEEANAYATYSVKVDSGASVDKKFDLLEKYNFVKQSRVDLEIEIQRCQQVPRTQATAKPTPTQHASIALGSRNMLRNILSGDTLHRRFVSMPALAARVSADIERFLTWPDNRLERIALVAHLIEINHVKSTK